MNTTDTRISDIAADFIVAKMHRGQPFSIVTIHLWIFREYSRLGDRGTFVLTRLAVESAKRRGLIVRKVGRYAPGVTEGWLLA